MDRRIDNPLLRRVQRHLQVATLYHAPGVGLTRPTPAPGAFRSGAMPEPLPEAPTGEPFLDEAPVDETQGISSGETLALTIALPHRATAHSVPDKPAPTAAPSTPASRAAQPVMVKPVPETHAAGSPPEMQRTAQPVRPAPSARVIQRQATGAGAHHPETPSGSGGISEKEWDRLETIFNRHQSEDTAQGSREEQPALPPAQVDRLADGHPLKRRLASVADDAQAPARSGASRPVPTIQRSSVGAPAEPGEQGAVIGTTTPGPADAKIGGPSDVGTPAPPALPPLEMVGPATRPPEATHRAAPAIQRSVASGTSMLPAEPALPEGAAETADEAQFAPEMSTAAEASPLLEADSMAGLGDGGLAVGASPAVVQPAASGEAPSGEPSGAPADSPLEAAPGWEDEAAGSEPSGLPLHSQPLQDIWPGAVQRWPATEPVESAPPLPQTSEPPEGEAPASLPPIAASPPSAREPVSAPLSKAAQAALSDPQPGAAAVQRSPQMGGRPEGAKPASTGEPPSEPETPGPDAGGWVPTEVGQLPADLWGLIDEPVPVETTGLFRLAAAGRVSGPAAVQAPPAARPVVMAAPQTGSALIQRAPDESSASPAGTHASQEAAPGITVEALARQVYERLRRRLSKEWERTRT